MKIKLTFILFSIIAALAVLFYIQRLTISNLKDTIDAKETIITAKQQIYKNDSGRWVNATNTWRVTAKDLKIANKLIEKANKDKTIQISTQQQELSNLYNRIQEQKIRMRDLESANAASMETINKLQTKLSIYYDSLGNLIDVRIDSIKTKFLSIKFNFIPPDSIQIQHKYRNTIYTFVEIRANRKENGKKHIFFGNWKWLWGRETITKTVSEDKNAKINNNIAVEIK